MGSAFHEHEEMTFEHFVLFVKSHKSQIEGNVNVYLKLEPSLSDLDRKMIGTMLESFIQFLTHPNIEEVHLDYDQHLDTWMQSHLSIMTTVRFNFFRIIFEKSLITLMVQMKYNRTASVMIFLLSIFSRLVQSYHQWGDDESRSSYVDFEINAEVRRLKLLYKLDERLIRSSGTKDLAEILKGCEELFDYKRCVFYAYIPWSNEFYGVIGPELSKVQSMKGRLSMKLPFTTVINTKKPLFLKNPRYYVNEEHIELFNLSSVVFVPIVHEGNVFGWVTFDQMGEEFDCSKEELSLLGEAGERIGLYLTRMEDEVSSGPKLRLTERESMILELLADGYDNKKMGELLHLSEHTVRDYVRSLMTKFKAKNRTQVVVSAFRLGLIN